jgi:hypothetical protein
MVTALRPFVKRIALGKGGGATRPEFMGEG